MTATTHAPLSGELVTAGPTLAELAATAKQEHAAVGTALHAAVGHAVAAGDALLEAQRLVGEGKWMEWLAENFGNEHRSATVYMRLAAYREHLDGAETITAAMMMLRHKGLRRVGATGKNGAFPPETRARAIALVAKGMTYTEASAVVGVSRSTVDSWVNAKEWREREAKRAARRREQAARKRQITRDRVVARKGGQVAEAYALVRRALQAADRAADVEEGNIREALRVTIEKLHAAEGALVRASKMGAST